MSRPRLLDLFCGAGGASMGYHRAGFDVTGVDIKPQPRYPFDFIQGDALEVLRKVINGVDKPDAIAASPPCQAYCVLTPKDKKGNHPQLIVPVRELLQQIGRPYIIENVSGAKSELTHCITLCGSMFGLDVRRHRLFESNVTLFQPHCMHDLQEPRFISLDKRRRGKKSKTVGVYGGGQHGKLASVVGVHGSLNYSGELELRRQAMGIDWMTNKEITQAIPPAYTEWLGRQLLTFVEASSNDRAL